MVSIRMASGVFSSRFLILVRKATPTLKSRIRKLARTSALLQRTEMEPRLEGWKVVKKFGERLSRAPEAPSQASPKRGGP